MSKPLSQGRLDGLCGLYSTINAFDYLYSNIDFDKTEELFKHLVIAKRDLFPAALYDGTDIPDVRDWVHEACNWLKVHVEVSEPFAHRRFDTTGEYVEELRELVKHSKAIAIVGLGKPWDHWTVITDIVGNTIHFHDSYGLKTRSVNWIDIRDDDKKTRIVTKETILVVRKD